MSLSELIPLLAEALLASLYMTFFATLLSYLLGLPMGVLLTVTASNSLLPAPHFHRVLGFCVNLVRSVPFFILMVAAIPLSRAIVGTPIGPTAMIVPLTVSATPLIARVTEATLSQVDSGVIEAARSMGASPMKIITRVLLPECRPALIQDLTISAITILGYTAMAGLLGGGGLGDFAIRFGFYRYETSSMFITIVVLIVIVQIIGVAGEKLAKRLNHQKK